MRRLFTYSLWLVSLTLSFGQTSTFDNLNANPLTDKAITWTSSNYGNGFGHRIVNSDPGFFTLLNFQGRNNNSSWTNIMSLTSDGRVGIGSQDPSGKLHIVDNSTLGGKWQPDKSYLTVSNGTDHLLIDNNEIYGFQTLHFGSKSGDIAKFRTVSELGSTDHVIIKANGRVGIGTITPDSELTVKGKIHAEEVKVDLSVPGPDYVFKEDYKLKPLKEVQNYIKEYGHLPNIPSAKEMEENGIDLGGINMKLLEKIEELTLYIIELENKTQQIKSLEGQLKQNRKEIEQLKNLIKKSNR